MFAEVRNIVALVFVCVLALTLPTQGARSKKPKPVENKTPAVEIAPMAPMYPLAGKTALPSYLHGNSSVLMDANGVIDGELRTVDTDLLNKDFMFDVRVKFTPGRRNQVFVGMGENNREESWITGSIAVALTATDNNLDGSLTTAPQHTDPFNGALQASDECLIRMQKSGSAMTITVAPFLDGKFMAQAVRTVPDTTTATFLNARNGGLFISGDSTITAVALSVDGKQMGTDTPAAPEPPAVEVDELKEPLFYLKGQAGLPAWLRASAAALADSQGIIGGEIRTIPKDLNDKDFVFDLLYKFKFEDDHAVFVVGIGENGREGGWILNSICSRVHGPGYKGLCTLNFSKEREEVQIGTIGADPASHMLRIEKHGAALTFSVCADYKGRFSPTFSRTIPDLKRAAPFLSKLNSSLFASVHVQNGDGGPIFEAVRLVVDGKPAETGIIAQPPLVSPADQTPALLPLGGQSGLPPWLKASDKALDLPDGIRGGELRSIDQDLIDKDFTFDLLYQFHEDERSIFRIGLGENGQNGGWILNTVCSRVHGPGYDAQALVMISGHQDNEPLVGRTPKDPGPHLFRLQKRGKTLTMSICADFKGTFEPSFFLTIPDLRASAPFLTKNNSSLFIAGDSGDATCKAVRLVVDGKPPVVEVGTHPDAKGQVPLRSDAHQPTRGPANASPQAPEPQQRFDSPGSHFSVSFPNYWRRVPSEDIQQRIDIVHQTPAARNLRWEAVYQAAQSDEPFSYPYVILQVAPYENGQLSESEIQSAVKAMTGTDFKAATLHTGNEAINAAIANASMGVAQYDAVNHVVYQPLDMNVPDVGMTKAMIVHHFGHNAVVSVMCYDRARNFYQDRESFDKIIASFRFDQGGAYVPHQGLFEGIGGSRMEGAVFGAMAAGILSAIYSRMRRKKNPAARLGQ